MPRFGETAAQFHERRGNDDEVWIKGFREGNTQVRFLMEPDDMVHYQEHYDKSGVGYFPCGKTPPVNDDNCPGCNSPLEEVRRRQHRYASCVLDAKGYQQVYKLGSRLHGNMQQLAQGNNGTICDRDFTIVRSGKQFNEISYLPMAGEVYPVDFDDALIDIPELLGNKYEQALKAANGTDREYADAEPDESPEPDEAQAEAAPASNRIQPAKKAAGAAPPAKKAAAKKAAKAAPRPQPQPEPEPEPEPEYTDEDGGADVAAEEVDYAGEGGDITQADFADYVPDKMQTQELKDFLAGEGKEFPPEAPRSRLVKIAKAYIASFPPSEGAA